MQGEGQGVEGESYEVESLTKRAQGKEGGEGREEESVVRNAWERGRERARNAQNQRSFQNTQKSKKDLWFKRSKPNILSVERSKVFQTNEQKT